MNTIKSLLIITLAIGFASCTKTRCPAFPIQLRNYYYPYINGDILKFTNPNKDTLTIKVIGNEVTDKYSLAWNCKCVCEADASFDTEFDNTYLLKIKGSMYYSDDRYVGLGCSFHDKVIGFDTYRDEFEISRLKDSENINAIFGDTIYLEKQDYHRVNNVKIVKNKGIVEFWDKQQNCNWVKIE